MTSALTLAEVLWIPGKDKIPKEDSKKIQSFFRNPYISVATLDRRTAMKAQDLVWYEGIRSKDAIHVATAVLNQAVVMETFDEDLIKKSGKIVNSPLEIRRPLKQKNLFTFT